MNNIWNIKSGNVFRKGRKSDELHNDILKNVDKRSHGILIVQIDGLSRAQFERAISNGNMPFVSSLLAAEKHQLHSFYSGLPSSTPAVQAELFYGVKCSVPSFGFFNRTTSQLCTMLQAHFVKKMEMKFESVSRCLLKGGCAYSDVYKGGAQKASYCVTGKGMEPLSYVKKILNPAKILAHVLIIPRLSILIFFEIFLSFIDVFRGVVAKENFISELSFIPARVGICVLLRELVVIGVCDDIKNNIKTIHCNFLGYDEQAHRRGPSSRFAHWTLKGIDDSIKRIIDLACKNSSIIYELWIYSDHGQETTKVYSKVFGKSLRDAITDETGMKITQLIDKPLHDHGIQLKRIQLLKRGIDVFVNDSVEQNVNEMHCSLSAVGPLAHLYFHFGISSDEKLEVALILVKKVHIPSVFFIDKNDDVILVNDEGVIHLKKCNEEDFSGSNHKFAKEILNDMETLVRHADAGELVLSGWSRNSSPLSFPSENGSHGGPGPEETHGFALFPAQVCLSKGKNYIRPIELRELLLVRLENFGII